MLRWISTTTLTKWTSENNSNRNTQKKMRKKKTNNRGITGTNSRWPLATTK